MESAHTACTVSRITEVLSSDDRYKLAVMWAEKSWEADEASSFLTLRTSIDQSASDKISGGFI